MKTWLEPSPKFKARLLANSGLGWSWSTAYLVGAQNFRAVFKCFGVVKSYLCRCVSLKDVTARILNFLKRFIARGFKIESSQSKFKW